MIFPCFSLTKIRGTVFTIDQISSESFQKFIHNGIRPGIILPDEVFGFPHYFLLKEAVSQGAIPIVLLKLNNLNILPQKQLFRPLLVYAQWLLL